MKNFTGKRFVTKATLTDVLLDSRWSEKAQREIETYGNFWGVWDKQEQDWVCSTESYGGSIIDNSDRSEILDLANHLNDEVSKGLNPYRSKGGWYEYQAGDKKQVKN